MELDKFQLNVNNLKIAKKGEDSVCKTIEELLELNTRIPKRVDKPVSVTTEKQFDGKDNKGERKEQTDVYEKQLDKDRKDKDLKNLPVQEQQLNDSPKDKSGHSDDKEEKGKVRGHDKKNVYPLWLDVYKKEDARKDKPIEKKLKSK